MTELSGIVAVEAIPTTDGRLVQAGAISNLGTPIPLIGPHGVGKIGTGTLSRCTAAKAAGRLGRDVELPPETPVILCEALIDGASDSLFREDGGVPAGLGLGSVHLALNDEGEPLGLLDDDPTPLTITQGWANSVGVYADDQNAAWPVARLYQLPAFG